MVKPGNRRQWNAEKADETDNVGFESFGLIRILIFRFFKCDPRSMLLVWNNGGTIAHYCLLIAVFFRYPKRPVM